MVIHTYKVGDTDPDRTLTLARPDGSTWLVAGDTVALIDRLPDGTTRTVAATITNMGDGTTAAVVTAPAPDCSQYGNVVTVARRTSSGGETETMAIELVYAVKP